MPINPVPSIDSSESSKKDNKKVSDTMEFLITDPLYTFEDVILPEETLMDIDDMLSMVSNYDLIFNTWGLADVIKSQKNISVNLYGKSGTGKTMTAHAIASKLGKKLMIVNYAEIESKYVGETSKNLVSLFNAAKEQDAIILFDEADALLSKRVTDMHSAADVSVNQSRSVLLKLLDEYNGVVLFTTNFINNFDTAFFRRIRMQIRFDLPDKEMRRRIWLHYLVDALPLADNKENAADELCSISGVTGSDIANAVLRTAISAAKNNQVPIKTSAFLESINKIVRNKESCDFEGYEVTTKQVSEEYVREKLNKKEEV